MSFSRDFKDNWGRWNRVALQALQGLRLAQTYRTADTRSFEFGDLTSQEGSIRADLRLIIESPWRIERSGRVLMGLDDARTVEERTDLDLLETDDEEIGRTVLARKLAELLHLKTDEGVVPQELNLRVSRIDTDDLGGFRLCLTDGYTLSVFPAGGDLEYWRLTCEKWHFVVEPGRAYYIGDEPPIMFEALEQGESN